MSNPDTTGTNIGGITTLGGFVVILIIILFNYHHTSYFNALLYAGLPIIIYLLMFVVLYISKKNTNIKTAFLSAVPSIGTTYLALFISYISFFRIPVASVFAPIFIGSAANIVSQPTSEKSTTSIPNSFIAPSAPLPPTIRDTTTRNAIIRDATTRDTTTRDATTRNAIIRDATTRGGSHKKIKKQAGGSCCSPTFSLDGVEAQFPTIKGISYGFYLFFAICFGGVFGSSMPSIPD
jgi:hypothetical protein|uniref:Uncharacterized protein n=1 Tax=viral metagenome TaxID=1070528 RepID=A0A6C0BFA8_9ZZZZ